MFCSENHNNNGVYPVAFVFPPLPGHENDNLAAASLHHLQNCHPNDLYVAHQQFSSSSINTNQMAPTTSIDPLMSYKAFWSNNMVMNIANERNFVNDCSEVEVIQEKGPLKKDRHSKIHTAQGLRDRRVRLSIGIAREFFDLQDMLGFDKASKTLEWLLKKSRKAIDELAKAKKHNNGCYNHTDNTDKDYENNCHEEQEEANDNDKDDNKGDNDDEKSFISSSSSECSVDMCNASKRSKAKARERVKEEAKNKVRSTDINLSKTISKKKKLKS